MSSSVVWVVYIHGVAIHGLHTWCSHPWSTYMDGYHDENMLGPMASRVEYEDGGTMVLQRADLLQQLVLERSLPLQISKRFGDGKWYKGALTKVLADGTQFRVEYTDGDVELQSRSQVRTTPVGGGGFLAAAMRRLAGFPSPDFPGFPLAIGGFSWLLRRLAAALQNGSSHFGAEPAQLLRRLQIFAAGC
jgi:hypothetical protein